MGNATETADGLSHDGHDGHYDHAYYQRAIPENWFAPRQLLRPDQLAAICYLFGLPFYGDEEYPPRPDPGPCLSVGCGTGTLEARLEALGVEVFGSDPSPAVRDLYAGHRLIQADLTGTLDRLPPDQYRSVIFCESLEHIPLDQILAAWRIFRDASDLRIVIVNWPARHPIPLDPSGWDHITCVDDALFDELSAGFHAVVRRGSHLVLDR